jgi:hypothetical protein
MQFRWVALLALWTLLSGPMLAIPSRNFAVEKTSAIDTELADDKSGPDDDDSQSR